MKRNVLFGKVLFCGMLLLAVGAALLLCQQRHSPRAKLLGVKSRAVEMRGAGMFPDFIALPGVSPRGVAVDKPGYVFVSVSMGTGSSEHIWVKKFTPSGEEIFSVDIGQGTIGGLMVTADGDLYIAVAAGVDRGVWRMDRSGNIDLLPGSNRIFFANGLAFDDRGTLYITESVSLISPPPPFGQGGIWRIPRGGEAELCLRDELLTGTGALNQPVPLGANGIAYLHGNLFVTNTEKGTVLRIPVWPDGSLGPIEVWATLQDVPESPLYGAPTAPPPCGDGIILDVHGNLYVAVLTRSAVVRLDLFGRTQETVAAFRIPDTLPLYAPLDFPASLFFGTGRGERQNLFVTNMGVGAVMVPQIPAQFWAGPGLVKIDAGAPGRPLH